MSRAMRATSRALPQLLRLINDTKSGVKSLSTDSQPALAGSYLEASLPFFIAHAPHSQACLQAQVDLS